MKVVVMADETLLSHVADIVTAHVSNNAVAPNDLAGLIQSVHGALAGLGVPVEPIEEKRTPAVSVRASIKSNAITCLDCGTKIKVLKRHLSSEHGLTPEGTRAAPRFGEEAQGRGSLTRAGGPCKAEGCAGQGSSRSGGFYLEVRSDVRRPVRESRPVLDGMCRPSIVSCRGTSSTITMHGFAATFPASRIAQPGRAECAAGRSRATRLWLPALLKACAWRGRLSRLPAMRGSLAAGPRSVTRRSTSTFIVPKVAGRICGSTCQEHAKILDGVMPANPEASTYRSPTPSQNVLLKSLRGPVSAIGRGDLVAFRKEFGKANLTSLVERRSRYIVLIRNPSRHSSGGMASSNDACVPFPKR